MASLLLRRHLALVALVAMEVRGFQLLLFDPSPVRRSAGRTAAFTRTVQRHRQLGVPSSLLPKHHDEVPSSPQSPTQPWWTGLAVATVVSASVFGLPRADAVDAVEISPGAATLETTLTQRQLINRSASAISRLVVTLLKERGPIVESVRTIETVIARELSSDTWREVRTVLADLQRELAATTEIHPPADWKRTVQDLKDGKVNVIVNGEIVNVSLEKVVGTPATGAGAGNGENTPTTTDDLRLAMPDDEWVLRVRGYRGVNPAVVAAHQVVLPRGSSSWFSPALGWLDDWDTPYPSQYLPDGVSKTYGDVWAFQGVLAVSFLYAWAYAYYGGQIEQQERDAKARQAAAAAAAAAARNDANQQQEGQKATKGKPKREKRVSKMPNTTTAAVVESDNGEKEAAAVAAPPDDKDATTSTAEKKIEVVSNKEVDVNVVIDFDEKGNVVITATETTKSRNGVLPFVQALCFPWLGMLTPGRTMDIDQPSPAPAVADGDDQSGEGFFSLVRALYFPWVGILQGK